MKNLTLVSNGSGEPPKKDNPITSSYGVEEEKYPIGFCLSILFTIGSLGIIPLTLALSKRSKS